MGVLDPTPVEPFRPRIHRDANGSRTTSPRANGWSVAPGSATNRRPLRAVRGRGRCVPAVARILECSQRRWGHVMADDIEAKYGRPLNAELRRREIKRRRRAHARLMGWARDAVDRNVVAAWLRGPISDSSVQSRSHHA